MIARTWRGRTTLENAGAYLAYLRSTGLPSYQATPGNRSVYVLRRMEGLRTEFLLISLWESLDAIRRFAGEDIDRAVFYPEDDTYLVDRDFRVHHFQVPFHSET